MVRETRLSVDDLIYPLFVVGDDNSRTPISAIPGCDYLSGNYLIEEAEEIVRLGIPAVLLFGVPQKVKRTRMLLAAIPRKEPSKKAVRTLKSAFPELTVVTDLCLCEYM